MGLNMNEDYLDSLLQSILDMEEKEEEASAVTADSPSEDTQSTYSDQQGLTTSGSPDHGIGDSGLFATDAGKGDYGIGDNGSTATDAGIGDYGIGDNGSTATDAGIVDYGIGDNGSTATDAGIGDYGIGDNGSTTTEAGIDDYGIGDNGSTATDAGIGDYGIGDNGSAATDAGIGDYGISDSGSPAADTGMGGFDIGDSGASASDAGMGGFGIGDSGSSAADTGMDGFGIGDGGTPTTDAGMSGFGMGDDAKGDQRADSPSGIDMSDIDALLRSISGGGLDSEEEEESHMSEDEIEALLRQTKESAGTADQGSSSEGDFEGQDWNDIQDLLNKSDQNEAVDENIVSMLNGEPNPSSDQTSEGDKSKGLSRSEKKAAAQKAKEEKAAKKKEEAEAKKQEKEVKKQEKETKKQEKESKKQEKAGKKASKGSEKAADDSNPQEEKEDFSNLLGENQLENDFFDADQILSNLNGEQPKETKKKGFFAKIIDFLLEEEEVEDSGEEKPEKKKKAEKTGKNSKKVKAGKAAGGKAAGDKSAKNRGEPDDDEESVTSKKKPKKPKKEKVPKAAASTEPSVKLPVKKVVAISALCATVGAAILVCSLVLTEYTGRLSGIEAYKTGNYLNCYMELYGKKLSEEEEPFFKRSECILHAQLPLKQYQVLARQGNMVEALDVLIQFVDHYPLLKTQAEELKVQVMCQASYEEVLGQLNNAFGLSEEQALSIAAEPDDVVYTKKVTAIANGESYQENEAETKQDSQETPKTDMLPEEETLPSVPFIEDSL
jgi:hypothetical protein